MVYKIGSACPYGNYYPGGVNGQLHKNVANAKKRSVGCLKNRQGGTYPVLGVQEGPSGSRV